MTWRVGTIEPAAEEAFIWVVCARVWERMCCVQACVQKSTNVHPPLKHQYAHIRINKR